MSFGIFRLSILVGVFVLMAGCGGSSSGSAGSGGSGGGGSNSTTVTVTFTSTGATPIAVATQIGSGSFTAATLSGNSLTFSLPSGTTNFAVAWVCPPINESVTSNPQMYTDENVVEASAQDGTSFTEFCPVPASTGSTGSTGTLTGSMDASAISGVNQVDVLAQNGTAQSSGFSYLPSGSFSFEAPAGSDRVIVLASNTSVQSYLSIYSLVAAKNFSSQAVPGALNGGNTVVLGSADTVAIEPITYIGVPSGFSAPTTIVTYSMGGGGAFLLANAATTEYPALPAGAMENGDYYYFSTYARGSSGEVLVDASSTSGGPISLTFPPARSYAGPAAAKWPSFDVTYTGFSGAAGVCDEVSMLWLTGSSAATGVSVEATANHLNGSTTVAIPDLSGLTGFMAAPASNTQVIWGTSILHLDSGCLQPASSNSTTKVVTNSGNYTTP